jgi:isopenicillin N synthase-like dioxygenase
MQRRAPV